MEELGNWASMESELKEVVCDSDLYLLDKAIESEKPQEYWLSRFIPSNKEVGYAGNILHLAVWHGNGGVLEKAMEKLPKEIVRLLLCQQETAGELSSWNPLHLAVSRNNNYHAETIVDWDRKVSRRKGFTGLKACPEEVHKARDSKGRTPALLAIQLKGSVMAATLTKGSRADLIQDIVDDQGNSPLFLAVKNHLEKAIMNLLSCQGPLCGSGPNGLTALHIAPEISLMSGITDRDGVYEKFFGKLGELITAREDNGFTVLHRWGEIGSQLWNSLSYRKDYIKNMYKILFKQYPSDAVKLMFVTDHKDGNNPLHHTATFTSEDAAIFIAEQLIVLHKSAVETLAQAPKATSGEDVQLEASKLSQNHDLPWLKRNEKGDTPLLLATRNKLEQLALCFLKAGPHDSLSFSGKQENPFILAVYNGCYKLAKEILVTIAQHHDLMSLVTFEDGSRANILDFALLYPDTFIEEVKEKLPRLIYQRYGKYDIDISLDKASEAGPSMLMELMHQTFESANWPSMDPKLKEAACKGNVNFLTEAIASSKPPSYWLSRFIPSSADVGDMSYAGNILHLAIWHKQSDFLIKANNSLPKEILHLLMRQQETAGELYNWNPLHLVIFKNKCTFLIESITECDSEVVSKFRVKEGLARLKACPKEVSTAKDSKGKTGALLAIESASSSANYLTSKHRAKQIHHIVDDEGNSPLFLAVKNGLDQVVMNLLDCEEPLCGSGPNGLTALHVAPGLFSVWKDERWHEVNKKLFERLEEQKLITATDDNGFTVLHKWVEMGSKYDDTFHHSSERKRQEQLFKWFFENYPDDAVDLMHETDSKDENNPLHVLVNYTSQIVANAVAEQLISLYKTYKVEKTTLKASNVPWLMKNKNEDTPFLLAVRKKLLHVSSYFLSVDPVGSLCLGDQQNPFIVAAYNQCYRIGAAILAKMAEHDLTSLLPFNDGCTSNVLHLASRYPEIFAEEVFFELKGKYSILDVHQHHITLGNHAEYRLFDFTRWPDMDAELKEAACSGNIVFLEKKASGFLVHWLCRFKPTTNDDVPYGGNVLHLAIWHGKTDFVEKALDILPAEVLHMLLRQTETTAKLHNWNPLHLAVSRKYQSLVEKIVSYSSGLDEVYKAQDSKGRTPALLAIELKDSMCAETLTKGSRADLIQDIVDNHGNSPLFLAVKNGLDKVVLNLLDCKDYTLSNGPNGLTALHVAPGLSDNQENPDDVYEKLFKRFPNHITKADNNGFKVLHKWVEMTCNLENQVSAEGLKGLFKYFLDKHRADATSLMLDTDHKDGNNPLHVLAATSTSSTFSEPVAIKIVPELINLYETCIATAEGISNLSKNHVGPWLMKNDNEDTPFLLAVRYKLEGLALCFLRQDPEKSLNASAHKENPLILAINNGCHRLVERILNIIAADKGLTSLLAFSDRSNILHSASALDYPETIITKVAKKFPSLINERDRVLDEEGETPLDKASEAGKLWLVELMVKEDPGSLSSARHAWQKACENGHISVIKSFVQRCPTFRGICLGSRDTPLHHMKPGKLSYAQYREFLDHKVIAEMINTRDRDCKTPLHKAIGKKDIDLAEALLTMDGIRLNIKDKNGITAMDLLARVCKQETNHEWREMCERVEIDPTLKTTYVQRETNLLNIREALLVVAALLATITFQAGFTLPGGLNSDTGEPVKAKKAVFLAFLVADGLAMCCSILVLFCLIWSMLCESKKSTLLIDRSILILLVSLYASLVAFMTGVYTVIHHKSLWVAILTIVMCSLIGSSATNGEFLYSLLAPFAEDGILKKLRRILKKKTNPSSETDSKGEASASTNQRSETNSKKEASASMYKSSETNSAADHIV